MSSRRVLALHQDEKANMDSSGISLDRDGVKPGLADREKCQRIEAACSSMDIKELARFTVETGGFLTDNLRRKAWPILLGLNLTAATNQSDGQDWESRPRHQDEHQVELDVNRSFVYYPENESDEKLEIRRSQLSRIITSTLRRYPMLCYFQGYHDIVQVLLLVLGEDQSHSATPRLSLLRIRDFMLPTLSPSFQHLQLLPAIVLAVDPKLARHLSPAQPFFALSSTLTMFAHDIDDYSMIARLFDFLLAHEASLSMYLFATIILSRREELFEIEPQDTDMLHFTLSKLPKNLDLDSLISKSMLIFQEHPPRSLPLAAWKRISHYSVLKTTQSIGADGLPMIQSLEEGQRLFHQQAAQVARQEWIRQLRITIWRYRGPIGGMGMAVLIGVLSIWLQRQERTTTIIHIVTRIQAFLNPLISKFQ